MSSDRYLQLLAATEPSRSDVLRVDLCRGRSASPIGVADSPTQLADARQRLVATLAVWNSAR
jgi:hypothetical protein